MTLAGFVSFLLTAVFLGSACYTAPRKIEDAQVMALIGIALAILTAGFYSA